MTALNREDCEFGEMFHTGLRKGADTKWSSILWNAIHLITRTDDEEPKKNRTWPHFVTFCQEKWVAGAKPSECVKAWINLHKTAPFAEQPPHTNAGIMFRLLLEECDQQTYDEVDGWIEFVLENDF